MSLSLPTTPNWITTLPARFYSNASISAVMSTIGHCERPRPQEASPEHRTWVPAALSETRRTLPPQRGGRETPSSDVVIWAAAPLGWSTTGTASGVPYAAARSNR